MHDAASNVSVIAQRRPAVYSMSHGDVVVSSCLIQDLSVCFVLSGSLLQPKSVSWVLKCQMGRKIPEVVLHAALMRISLRVAGVAGALEPG